MAASLIQVATSVLAQIAMANSAGAHSLHGPIGSRGPPFQWQVQQDPWVPPHKLRQGEWSHVGSRAQELYIVQAPAPGADVAWDSGPVKRFTTTTAPSGDASTIQQKLTIRSTTVDIR